MMKKGMHEKIALGIGEGVVAKPPHIISCLGLGSCVAVTLYDTRRKVGGVAHVMLPFSKGVNELHTPYQCADTAIVSLLEELSSRGSCRQDIVAKIAGGARMFACDNGSLPGIGQQNITSIKNILDSEGIPLLGKDIGGNYGRSIQFHLDSGRVIVTAVGKRDREI